MRRRLVAISVAVGFSIPLALVEKPGTLEAASAYKDTGRPAPNPAQTADAAPQKPKVGSGTDGRVVKSSPDNPRSLLRVTGRKPSPMRSAVQPGTRGVLKSR